MNDERFHIASLIRDQLIEVSRNDQADQIDRIKALGQEMTQYQKLCHQMTRARERGYIGAVSRLKLRAGNLLSNARYALESASQAVAHRPNPVPVVHDLVRELNQLEIEFGGWDYEPVGRTLTVQTEAIELEGIYLGAFDIRLHLGQLTIKSQRQPFDCVAVDPNPAASADHVTHPHVSDNGLCAGDATAMLRSALERGQICDFFLIVRQVLRTYNSDSPYISLENWDGESCHDCGYTMHEDSRCYCERCGHDYCDECVTYCRGCDETRCLGCVNTCDHCDEVFCPSCMAHCTDCGEPCCESCLDNQLCPDCRDQQEQETTDEQTPSEEQRQSNNRDSQTQVA